MPLQRSRKEPPREVYISVDVETAGPVPGKYSLLSIGACLVEDPGQAFYVELKPDHPNALSSALEISGLVLDELAENGLPPADAMAQFADWLEACVPGEREAVFVAFNAPFDWMFVNEYFHRYLGYNPFGYTALDIKAYYMGMTGVSWKETKMSYVASRWLDIQSLSHHALSDARDQARLFRAMLEDNDSG